MIKKIILILLFPLLLILLVSTQTGLQFGFQIARIFIPGKLSVTQLKGRLFDHITASDLRYQHKQLNLEIKNIKLHWQLLPFKIQSINAEITTKNINFVLHNNIIKKLTITDKNLATWQLEQSVPLQLTPNFITLTPVCLTASQQKICVHIQQQKNIWLTKLIIQKLQLASFQPWLVKSITLQGDINATLNIVSEKLKIKRGELQGKISNGAGYYDKYRVNFSVGQVAFNATLSGKLNAPKISGDLQIINGQFNVPFLNLKIRNLQWQAKGDNQRIDYRGQAQSGKGTIALTGSTSLKEKLTQWTLKGNNFLVSNTPQYTIYASPDLTLKALDKRIDITGSIAIPNADIHPPNYQKSVSMPADVIYINDKPAEQNLFQIYSNIKLILSNKIHFFYKGAQGQLTGALTITDLPSQPTTAIGRIVLQNGSYDGYGQKLTINPGILNFTNNPITNPNINIRAYRSVKVYSGPFNLASHQVLAGVQVTGTVNSPRIELFSEPASFTQSDILSLLVLGKTLNQPTGPLSSPQQNQQNELLMKAAMALSASSSSGGGITSLFGKVQQSLGIDVGTDTEQTGVGPSATQHSTVSLGKYLSPRLYVSYGMGIVESVSVIKIRYLLNNFLSLQSESSSLGNAIDLLYNFERN